MGSPMQHLRIQVSDDVYWWILAEAARAQSKAHEHAALILQRAYDQDHPDTTPVDNGDETAA